jgi:hypothetical protein
VRLIDDACCLSVSFKVRFSRWSARIVVCSLTQGEALAENTSVLSGELVAVSR